VLLSDLLHLRVRAAAGACGAVGSVNSNTRSHMITDSSFHGAAEQSSSSGVLLSDLLHLRDGAELVPVVFGCETRETGEIFNQAADGILGLGNSPVSLINQVPTEDGDLTFYVCWCQIGYILQAGRRWH